MTTRLPPADRSDLVAMGDWLADCLDDENQLVRRTVLRRLVDEIVRLRGHCRSCGAGTVDAATLCEREPRPIPACACDQEPYQ